MGEALLQVWDAQRGEVADIPITWSRGYDVDAKVKVPKRFESVWGEATKLVKKDALESGDGKVTPYPTIPWIEVTTNKLGSSASGAYAVAVEIFGPSASGWRIPPPYPKPTPSQRTKEEPGRAQ